MSSKVGRAFNIATLVLGVGLFVALLLGLDTEAVGQQLSRTGWALLPAFPLYVLNLGCSVMAWRESIQPGTHGHRAGFWPMLAAFWAGHAINGVGFAAWGEVVKGNMMARAVKGDEIVASLVIYQFINASVTLAFTVGAPAVCLLWLDLPADVVAAIFGTAALFCVGILLVRFLLRRGMATRMVRGAARLPVGRFIKADKLEEKASLVDERIREFRSRRPASFRRTVAWAAGSRVFQTAEVWVMLYALFPDRDPVWLLLLALLTHSVNQIIGWAGVFIPGRVGVAEGGLALLFQLLGLGSALGLSFGILRRIRRILGVAVGLVIAVVSEARASGTEAAPEAEAEL